MNIIEIIKNEYFEQDWENPKYIFHGSRELLLALDPQKAKDSNGNANNEQTAIYASSVFEGAIPYAIKGKGRYDCEIGYRPGDFIMKIYQGIIPEDDFGYIYVCDSSTFHRVEDTCQYVSYERVIPLEIIKIYYKDFKNCFEYIEESKKFKTKIFKVKPTQK